MSKIIKILGTGCSKCKSMTDVVKEVILENNIVATVEKVEDIIEIMQYNVLSTPVLVVDEVVVIKGRIPSKNEVIELLK
ncbi:MAG: thioredoxin family protein [Polaribacter sp.]|uniref:thioredoxin family protein n=1 Tax=Polaribacter sp. TaxID=1920175 RepID=UPI00326550FB